MRGSSRRWCEAPLVRQRVSPGQARSPHLQYSMVNSENSTLTGHFCLVSRDGCSQSPCLTRRKLLSRVFCSVLETDLNRTLHHINKVGRRTGRSMAHEFPLAPSTPPSHVKLGTTACPPNIKTARWSHTTPVPIPLLPTPPRTIAVQPSPLSFHRLLPS